MTFCIMIKQELVVATCPLKKGQCYWQHTVNNMCMYTPDELTPAQFATLTGKELPTPDEQQNIADHIKKLMTL